MGVPTWRTSPAASLRWWIGPGVLTLGIDAPVGGVDAAWVRLQLPRLLAFSGAAVVVCDLRHLGEPDLSTVEVIARVRLGAGRLGQRVHLHAVPERLHGLCALTGLPDTAPPGGPVTVVCGRSLMRPPPGALSLDRRTASDTGAPGRAVPTPPR